VSNAVGQAHRIRELTRFAEGTLPP
jgi:hypothetical protein